MSDNQSGVERPMDLRIDDLGRQVTAIGTKVDLIHDAVVGTTGTPGMLERVRNLERTEKKRQKLLWTVLTALLGLIAKTFGGSIDVPK